jgi:hypothetical protein
MVYAIQSIMFKKDLFSIKDCMKFLTENKYKHNKLDITENFYRFRQINPDVLKHDGLNKVMTKDKNGIYFIIYYK